MSRYIKLYIDVCNDHKNAFLSWEHLKWIRVREYVKNMKKYQKLWKMKEIDVFKNYCTEFMIDTGQVCITL